MHRRRSRLELALAPLIRRIVAAAALIAAALISVDGAMAQPAAGDWYGTLQPPYDPALRIVIHLKKFDGDGYIGSLDSIDQGIRGIGLGKVICDGETLAIDIPDMRARFRGTWDRYRQHWIGKWEQGAVLALDLAKSPSGSAILRPQIPARPYPYAEEEVAYDNVAARVSLAGTLTLPRGPGPFPAVLLIAGSGPSDRDESIYGHKPFLVIADDLTRHGIAVLRVDKRGIGRSSGNGRDATTRDYADDVSAGLQFLRERKDIDSTRIGLVGHSEGGLIAPMVAAHDPRVAFVVLVAAPGTRGDAVLLAQARLTAADLGLNEAKIQATSKIDARIFAAVESASDPAQATEKVRDLLLSDARLGTPDAIIEAKARQAGSKWFMYFLGYDPVPTLAQVRCPVLVLAGSNDHQVPPRENLAAIRKALAGNPAAEIVELPRLNHLMQTSVTGSVLEYGQIQETIAPAALSAMSNWIVERTR